MTSCGEGKDGSVLKEVSWQKALLQTTPANTAIRIRQTFRRLSKALPPKPTVWMQFVTKS